jgi:hypothetical protein
MIIVGGECERRWKAAAKRRAMERQEAKIDDIGAVRALHSKAIKIARGSARLSEAKKRLDRITYDIDAEINDHRYHLLLLRQPKGRRFQIIKEVVAWAREEHKWVISARRVKDCWVYLRKINRQVRSDLDDEHL